jgi:hypothetical protein
MRASFKNQNEANETTSSPLFGPIIFHLNKPIVSTIRLLNFVENVEERKLQHCSIF